MLFSCRIVAGSLALAVSASLAHASEHPTAHFDWVRLPGAEACPSSASVQADVQQRLGYDPFESASTKQIEGIVARRNNHWEAQLFVRDAAGVQGTRELVSEAPECDSLGSAVALAVAVAIDPDSLFRAPEPTPPKPEPVAPAPTETPWNQRASLSLRAMASSSLPVGAVGPGLSVSSPVWHRMTFGAGAFGLPMRRSGNAGFAIVGGWGELCAAPDLHARFTVRACGRALGGVLEAFVFPTSSFRSVAPGHYRWFAGEALARASFNVWGPLFVEAEGGALVSITRQAFLADGVAQAVFREPPVAFLGGLGLGLTF